MIIRCGQLTAVTAVSLLLTACETTAPHYGWGSFPVLQYQALRADDASLGEQLAGMREHAEQARSDGLSLPPGFRAHQGLLYLKSREINKAWAMFNAEKAAFPESAPYMDRLLRRFEGGKHRAHKSGDAT